MFDSATIHHQLFIAFRRRYSGRFEINHSTDIVGSAGLQVPTSSVSLRRTATALAVLPVTFAPIFNLAPSAGCAPDTPLVFRRTEPRTASDEQIIVPHVAPSAAASCVADNPQPSHARQRTNITFSSTPNATINGLFAASTLLHRRPQHDTNRRTQHLLCCPWRRLRCHVQRLHRHPWRYFNCCPQRHL